MGRKRKALKRRNIDDLYIGLILIIAVLTRCIGFGIYPGGVHVDEAFSGYEAWCMLNYGTDSWGYHNPVYLPAWGSGMNVLNSILMMPFIKIWGLNEITIRLPQLIIGLISVWVFYLLLNRIDNKKFALLGAFFMAISPWHIMMSRWGLESNLAPGFILISTFFFVKGLDKEKYLMLSALFAGLSLYCYAATWILVPVMSLIWGIYYIKMKKIRFSGCVYVSIAILLILAAPLILFVLVNSGMIPEIRTGFLSIPKMLYFRSDELEISNWFHYGKQLFHLIIFQEDGCIWNATPFFGLFYLISMPFVFIGGIVYLLRAIDNMKAGKSGYEIIILSWLIIGLCTGIVQGMGVHKINYCHIPAIILWAKGVDWLIAKVKMLTKPVIIVYLCCLVTFMGYYFTIFQEQISERQLAGARQAIDAAEELFETGEYVSICPTAELRHSRVLFYTKYPLDEYIEEVIWSNYPDKFLNTKAFGNFEWDDEKEDAFNKDKIYLLEFSEVDEYIENGWNVDLYDYVGVAYK